MTARFGRRDFLRRAALAGAALPFVARANVFRLLAAAPATKKFRGIFAILETPFDANDQIDWEDLEREVSFCMRGGAHGLVWPQLAAEFFLLTEEERMRGAEVILRKAAGGRSAVVIGVQAPAKDLALRFARHAEEKGADAVIALPPYIGHVSLDTAADYYRTLAGAVKIPIFIQNSGGSWGPAMPPSFVIQLAREFPSLGYIKEEVAPVAHHIAEYAASGVMSGIFSGNAGKYLLNEMGHGGHGTMPACEFIDVNVQVYELAASGKMDEARSLFEKLLPMIALEEDYGMPFAKAVLVRRGVFKTAKMRGVSGSSMDAVDMREVDAWWKELAPYLKA
ncbi:MAG: dihydrodipicolinate synthase family protein [Acidobacteriia bacterium]|nr:dihydrodipicolinate synthase family protein [Terriglobia bacterium]